jgi:ATP-dependent Clp protease ATP-binding subunit ClpA
LLLDFYVRELKEGFWACIPNLGIEVFAEDELQLEERLEETVRLHILRKRERSLVKEVVATMWYREVELIRREVNLNLPSLKELDNISEESAGRLVSKVATKLQAGNRVVFGREKELNLLIRALKSKFNKNIILVGPTGVGKTALIWELVRHLKKHNISNAIWETTASVMIKELSSDNGWQHQLSELCKDLFQNQDILFVRNLLELFEVGKYVGNEVSMADYMRNFISRGEVIMITECTEDELARIQLKNPNYTNFFQIIKLQEPKENLEEIIIKKVNDIAKNRRLRFEEEAVKETIRLNRRYTPYAGFPGKPIRFLESLLINRDNNSQVVTRAEVLRGFCEETGLPPFMVDPDVPMDLKAVEKQFNENVFGQSQAVASLTGLLASVKTALMRTGKPIASLLFIGPTGVGKTEMAKVLADFMFGNRERMIRFDMSEFADPYSVMRLTGESYFTDGLLTSAVRRTPFGVLLFDEIEKAHPDFYDLLLQILSEGRLTDSSGKLVNFCSTIIIMTSNIGAANLQSNRIKLGAAADDSLSDHFMSAVQKHFRPELFNRIDQVLPFEALSKDVVGHVVNREIDQFLKREGIRFRKMDLELDDKLFGYLAVKGYDPKYGARYLQRTIREQLVLPLAEELSTYDYDDQLIVRVQVKGDNIEIDIDADPLGLDLLLEELDKINLADQGSELRRKLNQLQESHYYVMMLSQLDIMERQREKMGDSFWKNKKSIQRYNFYLQSIERVKQLQKEISEYEENLALAVLDLNTYNPSIEKSLFTWKEKLLALKIYLYSNLEPSTNEIMIGIYGDQLERIAKFYLDIINQKGFEFIARSVWYRDSVYNEEVPNEQVPGQNQRTETYVYKEWELNSDKAKKPPKKGDSLHGIELKIKGDCAAMFFQDEAGIQRWWIDTETAETAVVEIGPPAIFNTPTNIHRKDFYKGNPRRVVEQQKVTDGLYDIKGRYTKDTLHQIFYEAMQERFEAALDKAM